MNADDTRRRPLGVLLGGTFWAAVGLGMGGLLGLGVPHRPPRAPWDGSPEQYVSGRTARRGAV